MEQGIIKYKVGTTQHCTVLLKLL